MELSGLHLLLTYQCNLECDHCFVWGSPWQSGTMILRDLHNVLQQAHDLGTIRWIYFEGGEPFLYYPIMLKGVQEAAALGFQVGIVSNGYWATDVEDALEWLRPFAGLIQDLSVSSDLYHWDEKLSQQMNNACVAADRLGIPVGIISIAQIEKQIEQSSDGMAAAPAVGQLPAGESAVMYRGRAAEKLVPQSPRWPWEQFTECPYENLRDPGRLHLDPFGDLHVCQGITVGNLLRTPLREICETYDPDDHSITGPLLAGGPVELVRRYALPHEETYADACHLCYESRRALRQQFPEILLPDQMYGVIGG